MSKSINLRKIKINGDNYILDTAKAIDAGALVRQKKTRPLRFDDIKNGDVFSYRFKNSLVNQYVCAKTFLMIDKSLLEDGQAIQITGNTVGRKTWFAGDDGRYFIIYKYNNGKWTTVSTIVS